MIEIATRKQLDTFFQTGPFVLFKHSPACGLSGRALRQLQQFCDAHPETPVGIVDVLSSRTISDELERRTGIRHESPQIFILRGGTVVWQTSHHSITKESIALQWILAEARKGAPVVSTVG